MDTRGTFEEFWYHFGFEGIEDDMLTGLVCRTLAELPNDIGDQILEEVKIIRSGLGSGEKDCGQYFSVQSLNNRAVILLSDDIDLGREGIKILKHEIAHHIKGHGPITPTMDSSEHTRIYDFQEAEAWSLVGEWEAMLL